MIHLIDNYYLTADNNSYTVGTARKKPDSRVILVGTRYYISLLLVRCLKRLKLPCVIESPPEKSQHCKSQ